MKRVATGRGARALRGAAMAGVVVLAGATGARAAVITQTTPISVTRIDDLSQGVNVPVSRFDPALGTLTSVDLRLTGTLTPGLVATAQPDIAGLPSPFPAYFTEGVTLTPGVTIATPGGVTQTFPAQTAVFTGVAPPGSPQTTAPTLVGTPQTVDLSVTAPPLSTGAVGFDFTGTGDEFVYVVGRSGAQISPEDQSLYLVLDSVGLTGQLQATYTYTPSGAPGDGAAQNVPEPASLALLGLGLAGLAAPASLRRVAARRPAATRRR